MYRFDKQELTSLAREGFARTRSVRFQDVDAAGVIFYPRLFEYCHDLYVELLAEHDSPLDQVLREGRWAAPIRHAEADYMKPLRFGDRVEVTLVRAHLEPSEVTLAFRLVCTRRLTVVAVAQSVHTFVSLPDFERCEIPAELRSVFQSLG